MPPTIHEMLAAQKAKALGQSAGNGDSDNGSSANESRSLDNSADKQNAPNDSGNGSVTPAGNASGGAPAKPVPRLQLGGLRIPQQANSESAGNDGNGRSGESISITCPAGENSDLGTERKSLGAKDSESVAERGATVQRVSSAKLIALASQNVHVESGAGQTMANAVSIPTALEGQVLPTAPERNLSPDETEDAVRFAKQLDSMYMVFDDAELFVNIVGRIMTDLKAHPPLLRMFADEDSRLMFRGMRANAGMARVKKQEARAKTAGRKDPLAKVDSNKMDLLKQVAALRGFGGASQ